MLCSRKNYFSVLKEKYLHKVIETAELKKLLNYLNHFFFIPSIIGVVGGSSAILFRKLIVISHYVFLLFSGNNHAFYPLLLPFIFYLTYQISHYFVVSPEDVTIDEIAKRISLERGGFNFKRGLWVLSLTSFNIGFGVPVGREGPIAKLGGVLSELFSKLFKIDRIHMPIYLTCGVASAISATFNAPLAAVLFGTEIVLGKINNYVLIPLVVSASVGDLVAQESLGDFTAFYVPPLHFQDAEIPLFVIIAFLSTAAALFFFISLSFFARLRTAYRHVWGKVVLFMGAVVGILLSIHPEVAGVGYGAVGSLFKNHFSPSQALEIAITKLVAVVLSFGSGMFGGVMAPSIFAGAFLGYFVGNYSQFDPRVFALVGSAALLSGISRAPFRSSLVIVELTHSYQLIIPILLTSVTTNFLIGLSNEVDFFKRALFHKGINVEELLSVWVKEFKISDYLRTVAPIYENAHVKYLIERFSNGKERYIPVVKGPKNRILVGIVSLRDLRLAAISDLSNLRVKDLMTEEPFVLTNDAPIEKVLKVVAIFETNLIPVVDKRGIYLGMFDVDSFLRKVSLPQ